MVRRFERRELILDAEFEVMGSSREQVEFTNVVDAMVNPRTVRVTMCDIAEGGVGVQGPVFLPRMTEGVVRVFDPADAEILAAAGASPEPAFSHPVRVRRCDMISRGPTYFIGLSFENPAADLASVLDGFIDRVSESLQAVALERLRRMEEGELA
ncbi:MAG: hypothetical protein ACF8PN_14425 [Phycisphaerales bacterium]